MSNQIILFGGQNSPKAPIWRSFGSAGAGEIAYCVQDGARVDPKASDLAAIKGQARAQLESSAGLLIEMSPLSPGNSTVKLRVYCKNPQAISAPDRALAIGLNGRHKWLDLKQGSECELDLNQSLIVPWVQDREKKLKAFTDSLDDLPDDLRYSMLFALILPTFEMRLARLEHIETSRKARREGTNSIIGGPSPISLRASLMISASVGLILGLGGYFLYRSVEQDLDAITIAIHETRNVGALTGSAGDGQDGTPAADAGGKKTTPQKATTKGGKRDAKKEDQ
jgi:hypothetical protein